MAGVGEELFEYGSQLTTPCQKKPERCEPRAITHVSFDADGVIWDIHPHAIASGIRPPFKRIDEDTIEVEEHGGGWAYDYSGKKPRGGKSYRSKYFPQKGDKAEKKIVPKTKGGITTYHLEETGQEPPLEDIYDELQDEYQSMVSQIRLEPRRTSITGSTLPTPLLPEGPPTGYIPPETPKVKYEPIKTRVALLPTFRDTVEKLDQMGIKMTVISLNTPGSVKDLLKGFDLADKFVEIRDSWEAKDKVFAELTTKHHLSPCSSIFVDDTMGNVESVAGKCALALHMGRDIHKPADIFNYILVEKK